LLKKVHPEGKPWVESLRKDVKSEEQLLDDRKNELLKAMFSETLPTKSQMMHFAYLLFGPKMIRAVTSHNLLGLPSDSLEDYRAGHLTRIFGESEAAPVSVSLVRGQKFHNPYLREF
jgi:hypothetical protein